MHKATSSSLFYSSFATKFTNGNPSVLIMFVEHFNAFKIFNNSDFSLENTTSRNLGFDTSRRNGTDCLCSTASLLIRGLISRLFVIWTPAGRHTVAHCYQLRVDTLAFSCRSSSTTYLPTYLLYRLRRVGLAQQPPGNNREPPPTSADWRCYKRSRTSCICAPWIPLYVRGCAPDRALVSLTTGIRRFSNPIASLETTTITINFSFITRHFYSTLRDWFPQGRKK